MSLPVGVAHPDSLSGRVLAVIIFVSALMGVMLSFLQPALNAPDEVYHWQRAVQVSHGQFLADRQGGQNYGGSIDASALALARWANGHFEQSTPFSLSQVRQLSNSLEQSAGMVNASFPSSASFTPLTYLPQALGIGLTRSLGGGVFSQMIAGRMANLLTYLALITLAICVAPCGRRLLLVLALTAPALHLAASVSGDPLNFALPAVLFAWCLRLRLDQTATLPRRAAIGLGLLLISLALLKPIYLLLGAIALLVPPRHFGSRRKQFLFLAIAFGAGLVLTLAWNAAYPFVPGRYWGTGADAKLVLRAAVDTPFATMTYFVHSLTHQLPIMWLDGWGRLGGYPAPFMTIAPQTLAWAALSTTMVLAASEGLRYRDLHATTWMSAVAIMFTGLVFVAFWLAFSPPNAAVIQGVQGRYFQLAFLLVGWACVCAAPFGDFFKRLGSPLLGLGLALQLTSLLYGVEHFRFYWSK